MFSLDLEMATSFGTAASAAAKSSAYLRFYHIDFSCSSSKLSFSINSKPKLRFLSKGMHPIGHRSAVVRAQSNEVSDGSPNASASSIAESEAPQVEDVKTLSPSDPTQTALASDESVSAFLTHVGNLVKLIDSKDIVELELKQLGFEVSIRKKESLPPPPSPPPAPPSMMQQSHSAPPPAPPVPSAPSPAPASPPAVKSLPSAPKSSHPPLKCPMAGTFYRAPAPGEPPFVKVGDKVKKGQVLCIIEAMKLMNEIEADRSGTVVEIIAEDGKPVSLDTPLFVIAP